MCYVYSFEIYLWPFFNEINIHYLKSDFNNNFIFIYIIIFKFYYRILKPFIIIFLKICEIVILVIENFMNLIISTNNIEYS